MRHYAAGVAVPVFSTTDHRLKTVFAGEGTMEQNQTKLLLPALRPLYEWAEPVSWLLVRLTVGLMIIPHGWPKVMAGIGPTAANALAKRGIEPAEPSPSFSLCWKR
jgi:hypothetical protein